MRNEHKAVIAGAAVAAVANPVLAPVAVPVMIGAVRHAAWEQSQAVAANNEINSLRNQIIQGIVANGSKRYVPDGVMLVCSTGMNPAKLKVVSQQTVKIASGKLMATLPDRMDCNFNCIQMVIAGAIIGAIIAVAVVAVIALTGGFATAGIAMAVGAAAGAGGAVGGAALGGLAAFVPCICGMLTSAPWIPVHPCMKIGGNMALIESSKLSCFLGGSISIIYSPELAEKEAERNRTKMWFDLGLVVLGGIVGGATMTGIGGLCYGGYVAFAAGATTKASFIGLGTYALGTGTNIGVSYGVGWGVGMAKDHLIYENIDITTADGKTQTLYDLKTGENLPENETEPNVKGVQETATDIAGLDAGSTGGVYSKEKSGKYYSDGVWDSDNFGTKPSSKNLLNLGKENLGTFKGYADIIGIKKFTPNKLERVTKRVGLGLDLITDNVKIFRSIFLIKADTEIESLEHTKEIEAKKAIKVSENYV